MKTLFAFILSFIVLSSTAQDPLKKYEVEAVKRLKADNYFIWQGDTIRKDSIVYVDNKLDSIRVKYIHGNWSKWFVNSQKIRQWLGTKEPVVTKGNLTESITGLQFDNTRQVIGGSADLSLTPGYLIPTTASATSWDNKAPSSGSGNYIWNGTSQQPSSNYNISGYGIHGDYIQATTAKLTNLTDGYIPYHMSDASGLGNSPIYTDGQSIQIHQYASISPNGLTINGAGDNLMLAIGDIPNPTNRSDIYLRSTTEGRLYTATGNLILGTDASKYNLFINNNNTIALNSNSANATLHVKTIASGNQKLQYWTEPSFDSDYGLLLRGNSATGIFGFYGVSNNVETNILSIDRVNNNIKVTNLVGTGTRLVGALSDGTLTPTSLTSTQVTTALGYTPYNSTNPSGYITSSALSGYATQNWVSSNFDNYGAWYVATNGTFFNVMASHYQLSFNNGNGIAWTPSGSGSNLALTANIDINVMTEQTGTFSNNFFIPVYTSGAGSLNRKLSIINMESVLGTTSGTASRLIMRDASADAYAHNFILSSDRRLKKNIVDLHCTDWTNKIQFKQFQFKDDPKSKTRYGVIAQDIEKIAPQLVSTDDQGNKAVAYIDLLIAKITEMDKQIKSLQNEIESLKNR